MSQHRLAKLCLVTASCALATLLSTSALADKKPPRSDRDRDMFARVDSDGDGYISAAEHAAGIAAMTEKMNQRFTAMDADGDGRVSAQEAKEHHQALRAERRDRRDHYREQDRDRD
ncbi:hypothetical protein E3W66_06080 [Gammaproteobacteria bacterium LSUCC0057]|jgi:hypothetical protein|uniref:EF-hand domain-containing protein n=1 Tax=Gammaproteobacteria bacterium LSUCC0057 TaxID=2559237 RepID=A0A4Y8UG67_9GAMM|nr:hypothetical protein E3W66_06080 [Gammaproteobacteria bacterium LSUCC0057]